MKMGYSLFLLEKPLKGYDFRDDGDFIDDVQKYFEYLGTYDTLKEAKIAQKEIKQKTIILQSY